MKLTEILNNCSPEKAKIIDEITKYHPGYGVEKGYSYYVGGMTDTGDWLIDKLIKVDIQILKQFLDKLNEYQEETNKQREELEHVQQLSEKERDSYYRKRQELEKEQLKKISEEINRRLIWGK